MKMPSLPLDTLCLICTILQIFTQRAHGDGGVALWTNRYNGPGNGTDVPSGVGVDAAGNIFVTGSSANSSLIPIISRLRIPAPVSRYGPIVTIVRRIPIRRQIFQSTPAATLS